MTETRRRWLEGVRAFIRDAKRGPCKDCGGTFDPVCMDFDHRPGEVKLFNISRWNSSSKPAPNGARGANGAGLARIKAEIAKCDLVCANCHRLRTAMRGIGVGVTLVR